MNDVYAGLTADDYDRAYTNAQLVARISGYLRPARWAILAAAALIVCVSLLTSAVPILIAQVINRVEGGQASGFGWAISLVILTAAIVAWAMNWGRQVLTAELVGNVIYRLQTDAAGAALDKDMAFHDRNSVGTVLSRVTGDTEGFSTVLTLTLNLLSQLFLVVILAGILFWIDLGLALIVLAMAPFILVTALAFRRVARQAAQRTRRVMARVNANVHESMAGIAVAKSFGQEALVYRDFDTVNRLSYDVYVRQGLIYSVILPVLTCLAGIGTAVVLYFGGRFTILGDLGAGDWYFAVAALGMLWVPLTQAASFWSLFQQGLAASERVFALLDSDDSLAQTGAAPVGELRGEIEFDSVHFSYSSGQDVFTDLSLRIAPGQTVAIVGHTGAGKSSVAKVLTRSYEFQQGKVLIDGRDIRSLDITGYRRQLGVVPQEPFLFSGTLADNIAYARPGATREDVELAIDKLGRRAWALSMAVPLDTEVMGNGRGISVGQRQMISLARVALKQASIVILDEPTASVDPLTESGIQAALDRLLQERTVIVIAHRLSTIRKADRVLVLHDGELVEDGSFSQLLRQGGHFAELYKTYYAHQSE